MTGIHKKNDRPQGQPLHPFDDEGESSPIVKRNDLPIVGPLFWGVGLAAVVIFVIWATVAGFRLY